MSIGAGLTAKTRQRYDRIAGIYDASEAIMERFLDDRGRLVDVVNPIVVRIQGANINR